MAKISYKWNAVLLIFLFLSLACKHPFYLSVTDLKYDQKQQALQGSVKIFVSDLEGALKKQEGHTIDLIHPKDSVKTRQLLDAYLKQHLKFKINSKPLSYTTIGFEQELEAVWIYIELTSCPQPRTIAVENSILYDFLSGQSNIVHIEANGQRKSLKADNPEKDLAFEF